MSLTYTAPEVTEIAQVRLTFSFSGDDAHEPASAELVGTGVLTRGCARFPRSCSSRTLWPALPCALPIPCEFLEPLQEAVERRPLKSLRAI
ncbi:MAG: hypothetical protein QW356_08485 [Candidatus Hadarchaeales archaeon]